MLAPGQINGINASPEAMVDELASRQHNLKHKPNEELEPFDRMAPTPGHPQ